MLGAIAGDIIGVPWESSGAKRHDFPLFTEFSRFSDDTVMTVAVAHALLDQVGYADALRAFGRAHPFVGYGQYFEQWLLDPSMGPYNSHGNGGAMRASPIGYAKGSVEEVLGEAERCAATTHNHPEGVRGAQEVALGVFLARKGASKQQIRAGVAERSGYDLDRSVLEIRPGYTFDSAAESSVPEAIICFLDGSDFEDTVRNAVSLGGDTDTMASISGAIAEAYWGGVPEHILTAVRKRLPEEMIVLVDRFRERFGIRV